MLDTDTKRRIDTARDILVGKVPDPKSQVEQITIALIYKFMDDMDAEAEELGGKRKFFAGEFARYGWAKLLQKGLGGHEALALYSDGISRMPENPGVPALFRDIFKNAYLPYRDPETLKAFLKIIDEFKYDHSERLGDAFEYLLSVLGSQGDAGQFRTPRHIIDFLVQVINPQKNESILDPACGTAGFLISAWKHIQAQNQSNGHSTLTPDERGRLARNIKGYDISPDMVRLSLANLYLHGFTDPHVVEYDTLTSEERWNEYADVILANPPFMSPKGGIKPHKLFSVQSKRSEVLFVDYMAEHLTPNGRAGIIVPEGIIFQSQGSYKELRKMLVENSLVAVISLPAGVFQPYSGVKTSILVLDRSIAKQSDSVAFFKVENDGFSLGAQRRSAEKDDLPTVRAEIAEFLHRLRARVSLNGFSPTTGQIVSKEKIAENGDYNLSGERYREGVAVSSNYPLKPLGELFAKINNGTNVTQLDEVGRVRVSRIQTIADGVVDFEKTKFTNDSVKDDWLLKSGDILLSHINSFDHLGKSAIFPENAPDVVHGINLIRMAPNSDLVNPRYAIRIFKTTRFLDTVKSFAQKAVNQASVRTSDLRSICIPLPPLDVQKEIVTEIEGYQKVIDGARQVVDNYRPHIAIDPEWPEVTLNEVLLGKPKNGYSGSPVQFETKTKVLSLSATTTGTLDITKFKYLDEAIPADAACRCRRNDIYLQRGNTAELVGTAAIFDLDDSDFIYPDLMIRVQADPDKIIPKFLLFTLQDPKSRDFLIRNAVGAAGSMPKINQGIVERLPLSLPPLDIQESIVTEIEAEQALVNANKELIVRFEKKIQAVLDRVWGSSQSEGEAT